MKTQRITIAMLTVGVCCALNPAAGGEPAQIDTPTGIAVSEADWPWWRGPTLDGHARGPSPPVRWSQKENVVWRIDVPGRGHASPCIWGERIFISTAEGKPGEAKTRKGITIIEPTGQDELQSLICYDRSTGKRAWRTDIHHGGHMLRHEKDSHATATPACDGQRVFVVYAGGGKVWITAVDFAGKQVWQEEVGPLEGRYGYGASPVLYQSLVIVNVDHFGENYIKAFERETGRVVWQQRRSTWYSFSSPVIASLAGRDQLLVSGVMSLTSYNPRDGKILWTCAGPSNTTAATPVWFDDRVIVAGGDPQTGIKCIRADGRGDVSASHVQWEDPMKAYVPSPLVIEDRLLLVRDIGVATCLEARTGRKIWEQRLGGEFSASPTFCGGLVFVPNEEGRTFVFEAGRKFKLVAENDLADGGFASPVIAGGRLYLRTLHALYCIGVK